jgi:hypothetical protein
MALLRAATLAALLVWVAACAGVSDRPLVEAVDPAIIGEAGDPAGRAHHSSPREIEQNLYFRF